MLINVKNQKLNSALSRRSFMVYFKAFTRNINNNWKIFFSENITIWNSGIIGTIVSHPAVTELLGEIVVKSEVKPDEDVKVFTLKESWRFMHNLANCPKLEILFRSLKCLKLLRIDYYKNIWRVAVVEKVAHIIQVSYVLYGEVAQVSFSCLNTYTDDSVAEFSVLEHLCSTSVHFKKDSHISRKWKIDWGWESLVRMIFIIVNWLSIFSLCGCNAL